MVEFNFHFGWKFVCSCYIRGHRSLAWQISLACAESPLVPGARWPGGLGLVRYHASGKQGTRGHYYRGDAGGWETIQTLWGAGTLSLGWCYTHSALYLQWHAMRSVFGNRFLMVPHLMSVKSHHKSHKILCRKIYLTTGQNVRSFL